MFRVEVVRRVDTNDSWDFEENSVLRKIIEWVLQESLESFVYKLLIKTCREIGKDEKEADNFWARVKYSNELKCGYSFHRNRDELNTIMPDFVVGFANDVSDFAASIVHEALHSLGWGEEIIEAKALEITQDIVTEKY